MHSIFCNETFQCNIFEISRKVGIFYKTPKSKLFSASIIYALRFILYDTYKTFQLSINKFEFFINSCNAANAGRFWMSIRTFLKKFRLLYFDQQLYLVLIILLFNHKLTQKGKQMWRGVINCTILSNIKFDRIKQQSFHQQCLVYANHRFYAQLKNPKCFFAEMEMEMEPYGFIAYSNLLVFIYKYA